LIELLEYTDAAGVSPYAAWREKLEPTTRARITMATFRLASGNTSAAKSVGGGVLELRLDFGPGYRIYFANDGDRLIILLGGGSKKKQQADIEAAQALWQRYKLDRQKRSDDAKHKKV
jgi:putative addiction module killer protein